MAIRRPLVLYTDSGRIEQLRSSHTPPVYRDTYTTSGSAPSGLDTGEQAVNLADHKLWIGGGLSQGYWLGGVGFPVVRNAGRMIIAGDTAGTALTTLTLTASRLYLIPFYVPYVFDNSLVVIVVTTAAAGTGNAGVYASDNTTDFAGPDYGPGTLLASTSSTFNMGSAMAQSQTLTYKFLPGVLYWIAFVSSSAATVRAVAVASVPCYLGRQANSTASITCIYTSVSGSTLPSSLVSSTFTAFTTAIPAIFLTHT